MEKIHLDDFLTNGILKEKEFRHQLNKKDWDCYKNKKVLIKGCSSVPVPIWSYLIITSKLQNIAREIYFGEISSAIKIYSKSNN
ncbi:MAG: hypothetical protein CMG00_02065 [Candidatus Marinimicrobia bacterium]|nr:hypothetical protein [Candidatus Neomarinimicrobiota bacterium]|tara:strand:+ start:3722 stop:3973 length:252 start_codon:yes stop_codon:yes gene_type:complete